MRAPAMTTLALSIALGCGAAKASPPELVIGVVTVTLTMHVEAFDAQNERPIAGATATLVRSADAKLLPEDPPDPIPRGHTAAKGVARLQARFLANQLDDAWVEVYPGNSYILVSAPGYSSARAWVSRPAGHSTFEDLRGGKITVQPIDSLRFKGGSTERTVSYRVLLQREKA